MNCIVVPVYKEFEDLNKEELISLKQLYKVLGKHQIYLVGPKNLKWDKYRKDAEKINVFPKVRGFGKHHFKSIIGYNELMTSSNFYIKFKEFRYMLIYQLDAYIFRDELDYWCNQNYDFIGAPLFENLSEADQNSAIIGVGNGGFSLRNISSFLKILKRIGPILKLRKFWFRSYLQAIYPFEKSGKFFFRKKYNASSFFLLNSLLVPNMFNEDYYWSFKVPSVFSDFKVAPVDVAIPFGFEANPSKLFAVNNNRLPFGCHAWGKYEPEFWESFISVET